MKKKIMLLFLIATATSFGVEVESSGTEDNSEGMKLLHQKRREINESILEVARRSEGREDYIENLEGILEEARKRVSFLDIDENTIRTSEEKIKEMEDGGYIVDGILISEEYQKYNNEIQGKIATIREYDSKNEELLEYDEKLDEIVKRVN